MCIISICFITFMYITDVLEPSLIDSCGILAIQQFYLDSAIIKCLQCSAQDFFIESSPKSLISNQLLLVPIRNNQMNTNILDQTTL